MLGKPIALPYWGPEFWNGQSFEEKATVKQLAGHPDQMVTREIRWKGEPKDEYYDLENPLGASAPGVNLRRPRRS